MADHTKNDSSGEFIYRHHKYFKIFTEWDVMVVVNDSHLRYNLTICTKYQKTLFDLDILGLLKGNHGSFMVSHSTLMVWSKRKASHGIWHHPSCRSCRREYHCWCSRRIRGSIPGCRWNFNTAMQRGLGGGKVQLPLGLKVNGIRFHISQVSKSRFAWISISATRACQVRSYLRRMPLKSIL